MKRIKIEKWVLSPHAVARMMERGISTEELTSILEEPDTIIAQGPKWILAKHFGKRTDNLVAAVILQREDKKLWLIITVMVRFERRI